MRFCLIVNFDTGIGQQLDAPDLPTHHENAGPLEQRSPRDMDCSLRTPFAHPDATVDRGATKRAG